MNSNIIKNLLLSTVLILVIDSVYLKTYGPLFQTLIKNIQGTELKLNLYGAFFSYLCIVVLFNYFVIYKNASLFEAFLIGFLTYGIFEGTSKALFSKWSTKIMIIDSLWGGLLFAIVLYILKHIKL